MRLWYALLTAVRAMFRARALMATSIVSLAAGLWLMGTVAMALQGGRSATRAWARAGSLACGVAQSVSPVDWEQLRGQVAALAGVASATVLTPEQSLAVLQAPGSPTQAFATGLSVELMPASLVVLPGDEAQSEGALQALAARIAAMPGIEDVDYGALPLQKLQRAVRVGTWIALALTAMLAATLLVLLTGSIRLMLYSRRDEVRILQLIGASKAYVRAPFLIEGVLSGVVAGAAAAAMSRGCEALARPSLQAVAQALAVAEPLHLFSLPLAGAQVAVGAAIGLGGSLVALRAFLNEDAQA